MLRVFTGLLIVIGFIGNLVSAAAHPKRLPGLDDETMGASFGTSPYHSAAMKAKIGMFHATGDTWTSAELVEYFLTGIFQHYAHELTSPLLRVDAALCGGANALLECVNVSIKNNPIFVGLGVCFHRNKILLEKKAETLRWIPETPKGMLAREVRVAEIMTLDRMVIDQQTAFYYWMKEILEGAVNRINGFYEASGVLPEVDDEVLQALSCQEPAFLTWDVYKALVPLALAEKLE